MNLTDPQVFQDRRAGLALQQGSAAWLEARTGFVTCSRLRDVVSRKQDKIDKATGRVIARGDYLKKREDYLAEKIVERLTGDTYDHYVTEAMKRGTTLEAFARDAYCDSLVDPASGEIRYPSGGDRPGSEQALTLYRARQGIEVRQIGIKCHPTIYGYLGSPDGLVGSHGMIEIKTVWSMVNFLRICTKRDFSEYVDQIQGLLDCLGRVWCDLILFDDRLPLSKRLQVFRIERDEAHIAMLQSEVKLFLEELDEQTILAERALNNMEPIAA